MMSKNKNGRTAKREAGGAGHSSVVPSSAALRRARILVVGDVMLDRYWFGDVSRISPEAPVPVVRFRRQEERLGGAANVANNCVHLGARTRLLSVTGADEAGDRLAQLAKDAGIKASLHRDAKIPTTVKLRVLSKQQL